MLVMTPMICFMTISSGFGDSPIPAEFEEGQKIYSRKKGIDRTEKDARVVIGKWFDGDRTQNVEEAIFLTPGLLSRWLGYQQASGNTKDSVTQAWKQFSTKYASKSVALIRLARLGTVDPVDGDVQYSTKPEAIDNVRIEMREEGREWQSVTYRVVQDIQERQPSDVLRETWDQVLAACSAWPSTPSSNSLVPEVRWGQNRRVSLLAETPSEPLGSKCEFRIVEKDRTRVIPFTYPKS